MEDEQLTKELNAIREAVCNSAWMSTALLNLLIEKKIITKEDFERVVAELVQSTVRIEAESRKNQESKK